MKQLRTLKRAYMGTGHEPRYHEIFPKDLYDHMKLVEEDKQIDQELVSQYFPPRKTVIRMPELFEAFLQLCSGLLAPEALTGKSWLEADAWSV